MKRIITILASAMLLVGIVGVTPALATDPTNLAGKPINGIGFGAGSTCHGTIYGRVNGVLVLFMPRHCNGASTPGYVWYGPNGSRIGVTGPQLTGVSDADTDMSWIVLDSGNYPQTGRNAVRVGGSTYYNDHEELPLSVGCSETSGIGFQDTLKVGYWDTNSSSEGPWTGFLVDVSQSGVGCDFNTTFRLDLGAYNIPSGAPLWDVDAGEFVGDAKGPWYDNGVPFVTFSSWRSPMINLRDNYYNHSNTYFCANSTCVNV